MRRLHRAASVRDCGAVDCEHGHEEVVGLTDEELQAAVDQIELQRVNALRALGIPVDE